MRFYRTNAHNSPYCWILGEFEKEVKLLPFQFLIQLYYNYANCDSLLYKDTYKDTSQPSTWEVSYSAFEAALKIPYEFKNLDVPPQNVADGFYGIEPEKFLEMRFE